MVCRFIDGFDYSAVGDLSRKWTLANPNGVDLPRNGVGGVRFTSTSQQLSKTLDDQPSWIVGFAFKSGTIFGIIVTFIDNITTQCSLSIAPDGALGVVRGISTAVAGGRSVAILRADNWYYIEMKVTIANSIAANSCVVRINEQIVLTVDAGEDLQVTGNATADVVRFPGNFNGAGFDDVYIFDGTDGGGTEPTNDDFAGDMKVEAHWPDGNGTTNNFLGSDADSVDNYLLVDEAITDDDTTYVESSTIGHIDLYTVDNLAETPLDFRVVQINSVVRKDDSGTKTVRAVVRPASTNFFGASKSPVDGTYTNEIEILNEDPNTEAAWTESGFNATEFGLEIET